MTAMIALFIFALSVPIGSHLGGEFMPKLSEGDIMIEANRLPSASLEGAIGMSDAIEKHLLKFPEVKTVFCKTGRPEIANDLMGVQQTVFTSGNFNRCFSMASDIPMAPSNEALGKRLASIRMSPSDSLGMNSPPKCLPIGTLRAKMKKATMAVMTGYETARITIGR